MLVSCDYCGEKFNKKPAEVKRSKHNACDRKCGAKIKSRKSIDRFFPNKVVSDGGCWNWQGAKNKDGYGIKRYKGKIDLAHRVSYSITNDECDIEKGLCVLHKCDNPACINPDHLFLGTHADNMRDMISKGRASHQKPITPPNNSGE